MPDTHLPVLAARHERVCETRERMVRRNFYASETANRPEVVRAGFRALAAAVEQLRSSTAWLVCHAYSNLDGFVEQVIGRKAVAALKNRQSVGVGCTGMLAGFPRLIDTQLAALSMPVQVIVGSNDALLNSQETRASGTARSKLRR